MPSEASLANLRPPWQRGQTGGGGSVAPKGYRRTLAAARKTSVEAMETIIACMRDPLAPWPSRVKACEVILDRAWGSAEQHVHLDGGIVQLRVEFHGAEHMPSRANGSGNGHDIIDVPLEPP